MANPPPPPPRRGSGLRHAGLGRLIAIILLAFIVLIGLIVLITWLAIHPRKLRYSIETGHITTYNLTNSHLTSNIHLVLRSNNPNKRVSVYYDKIEVTTIFEDQKLSINHVHPFYQPRKNVTYLDMYLVAKDVTLYGNVAKDLAKAKASGDVNLNVNINAKIRIKVGVFKIHRKLELFCPNVNVPLHNSRKEFERVSCDLDYD